MATPLLDSAFVARLERLGVLSRQILGGKLRGEHLSRRRGTSPEFDDFRPYSSGDDLRFIDWNLYARLDRLFVRLFQEEEELFLHLLIDASASMNYGKPNKLHFLRQLAAALGYVGLVNRHWVTLGTIGDPVKTTGLLRGRTCAAPMIHFLSGLEASGAARLAQSCRSISRQRGICVVLSDFFMRDGLEDGLRFLRARGHELFCIQLLSPQEIEPERLGLSGEFELTDAEETGNAHTALTPTNIARYKARLDAHRLLVEKTVARAGGTYVSATTHLPFDRLVLNYLRKARLLN